MKQLTQTILFLSLIFSHPVLHAQDEIRIKFHNLSFAEALDSSAKSGKLIFIDCYTSWCAPCKVMDQTVFTVDSIFQYYNAHFINLKIDMEKGEGVGLREKFKVASFPTYLFVNAKGELIHRTASLMPAGEFLNEGRKALSSNNFTDLKKRYDNSDRSDDLLANYALALLKVNRDEYWKVRTALLEKITDKELKTPLGWEVIDKMSQGESDRLGQFFLANQAYYESIAGKDAVQKHLSRIRSAEMYRLMSENKPDLFLKKLSEVRNSSDKNAKRDAAMAEMEYYLHYNRVDSFVHVANAAMEGAIRNNDDDLSFIARRACKKGADPKVLNVALQMARKAVSLAPENYSNQSTLGLICYELDRKDEGLRAARKARQLADASTSKIQKLAQDLVDKLETL